MKGIALSRHGLAEIIHQPPGASPRFSNALWKPDASAWRLIGYAAWSTGSGETSLETISSSRERLGR